MGFVGWLLLAGAVVFIYAGQKGTSPVDTLLAVLKGESPPAPSYVIDAGDTNPARAGKFAEDDDATSGFGKAFEGNFIRPTSGPMTSGFGMRWGAMHQGMDIAAPMGTPVKAAASGTVESTVTGWGGGYGNNILIKHAQGFRTRYAHLSSIGVKKGQQVQQGQVIGRSGNSGKSTGPHLHFEIHKNGTPVDPTKYVGR